MGAGSQKVDDEAKAVEEPLRQQPVKVMMLRLLVGFHTLLVVSQIDFSG